MGWARKRVGTGLLVVVAGLVVGAALRADRARHGRDCRCARCAATRV